MPPPETRSNEATGQRDARLNLRASTQQAALIRQAARASGKSITEFVLESATRAAEHVLADRRQFEPDETDWHAFQTALERPAILKPRLQSLLAESSLFER